MAAARLASTAPMPSRADELLAEIRKKMFSYYVGPRFEELDAECRAGRLPEAWSRHPGVAGVGESVVKTADCDYEKPRCDHVDSYFLACGECLHSEMANEVSARIAALEADLATARADRDHMVEIAKRGQEREDALEAEVARLRERLDEAEEHITLLRQGRGLLRQRLDALVEAAEAFVDHAFPGSMVGHCLDRSRSALIAAIAQARGQEDDR